MKHKQKKNLPGTSKVPFSKSTTKGKEKRQNSNMKEKRTGAVTYYLFRIPLFFHSPFTPT
jgi:hypothetical protein